MILYCTTQSHWKEGPELSGSNKPRAWHSGLPSVSCCGHVQKLVASPRKTFCPDSKSGEQSKGKGMNEMDTCIMSKWKQRTVYDLPASPFLAAFSLEEYLKRVRKPDRWVNS